MGRPSFSSNSPRRQLAPCKLGRSILANHLTNKNRRDRQRSLSNIDSQINLPIFGNLMPCRESYTTGTSYTRDWASAVLGRVMTSTPSFWVAVISAVATLPFRSSTRSNDLTGYSWRLKLGR